MSQQSLTDKEKLEIVKEYVGSFKDFPKPGIIFRDIFSILVRPNVFKLLHEVIISHVKSIQPPVEYICGIDSRGFIFGSVISLTLGLPFIPIRKQGKLPGKVNSITYDLEYGKDVLEIQEGNIREGGQVLIVDDLLATGGTLAAAATLISDMKGVVSECLVIIELVELKGRNKLTSLVHSFVQF